MGFDFLYGLLNDLSVSISEDNVFSPKTEVRLGMNIIILTGIISIPEENWSKLLKLVNFGSLEIGLHMGSLMYIHKCIKPACICVNRLLYAP